MKIFLRLIFIGLLVVIGIYLLLPSPAFPPAPTGSLVSDEPADTESIYRQAYYSNLSRSEIMNYYTNAFGAPLQFNLNYPPEDAGTLIRDQTRSNYLEELVHPGKQSLYINGYVPSKPEDTIVRDGKVYLSKITVHLVPSSPVTRVTVLLLVAVSVVFLVKEYQNV